MIVYVFVCPLERQNDAKRRSIKGQNNFLLKQSSCWMPAVMYGTDEHITFAPVCVLIWEEDSQRHHEVWWGFAYFPAWSSLSTSSIVSSLNQISNRSTKVQVRPANISKTGSNLAWSFWGEFFPCSNQEINNRGSRSLYRLLSSQRLWDLLAISIQLTWRGEVAVVQACFTQDKYEHLCK